MRQLQRLLKKHRLYYSLEELQSAKEDGFLELVGPANGDSYSIPVIMKFGKDYKMIMDILNTHNIKIADEIWYD